MNQQLSLLLLLLSASAWGQETVQDIFQRRCADCHSSTSGDPNGVFDPNGLPRPEQTQSLLEALTRPEEDEKHMPPGDTLPNSEIQIFRNWAETSGQASSSPKSCEWIRSPLEAKAATSNIVTDQEAEAILKKACVLCHGKVGLPDMSELIGATVGAVVFGKFALEKFLKLRELNRFAREYAENPTTARPPKATPADCSSFYVRIGRAVAGVGAVGVGAYGAYGIGEEALKAPHTPFLEVDGRVDPAAVASGHESLSRIANQVGGGFMPIKSVPPPLVGHYNDADRAKLMQWLRQQSETQLSPGCQVYALSENREYEEVARECSALGFRVPTGAQMKTLAEGQPDLQKGCYWTSDISREADRSRMRWTGSELASASPDSKCRGVCLR